MKPSFWCVAQTKPRQEEIGLVNLQRQGFLVNLPRIPRTKPPRLPDTEVLFPGYIFFCAPHHQPVQISCTQHQRGVSPG